MPSHLKHNETTHLLTRVRSKSSNTLLQHLIQQDVSISFLEKKHNFYWLVVSTHLKHISQSGGEHKKYVKPPPSLVSSFHLQKLVCFTTGSEVGPELSPPSRPLPNLLGEVRRFTSNSIQIPIPLTTKSNKSKSKSIKGHLTSSPVL